MADELEVTKKLKRAIDEMVSSAEKMSKYADTLDSKSLDAFTKSVKKALEATGDLGKEIAIGAKNFKQIERSIRELEKAYRDLQDAEADHAKLIEDLNKKYDKYDDRLTEAIKKADETLAARQRERDAIGKTLKGLEEFNKELSDADSELAKFRSSILKTGEEVKKNLSFSSLTEELTKRMSGAARSAFTWGNAIDLAGNAIRGFYKDLISVSNLGLGSMFAKLRIDASKFGMTLDEYTQLIQKNRDVINLMGGGAEGLSQFNSMLNQGLKQNEGLVNRLGQKGATQAISNLTAGLQVMGVTVGDKGFSGALKESSDLFLRMNAVYGIQAEEMESYYKQLMASEQMQRRLNSLSREEAKLEQSRLLQMTEELKARGLSLQQIAEFNTRLENLYDPTKSKFETRQKEAVGLQLYARQLQAAGGNVNMELVDQVAMAMRQGNLQLVKQLQPDLAKMMSEAKGTVATEAEKGTAGRLGAMGYGPVLSQFEEMAGSLMAPVNDLGLALKTAETQGKNLGGAHSQLYNDVVRASEAMAKVPESLANVRATLEQILTLWDSHIGDAVKALGVFTAALISGGLLQGIGGLAKGLAGLAGIISKIPGLGWTATGAGAALTGSAGIGAAAGAIAGIGAAGYAGWKIGSWLNETFGLSDKIGTLIGPSSAEKELEAYEAAEAAKSSRQRQLTAAQAPASTPATSTAVTTSPLGELIARGESGGSYNASNKGTVGNRIIPGNPNEILTDLTIGEVMRRQRLPAGDPDRLFAVGKYQLIPETFRDAVKDLKLSSDTKFSPDVQEQMFQYLITKKRPQIGAYISGQSNDIQGAMKAASMEWASIADPTTGRSYYGGANKASISAAEVSTALQSMRGGSTAGVSVPTPPSPVVATPASAPAVSSVSDAISESKKQTALLASIEKKIGQSPPTYKPNQRLAGEHAG